LVQDLYPQARTLRWDRDTTQRKGAHDEIMRRFATHEANVLIGTQMIAKGLDLPLVTLVGIVNADIGLYVPDLRAAEHTFQILAQVAGRAGRSVRGGRVIVQTYNPEHYAIRAAGQHDYLGFYAQELAFSRQLDYPPFTRLVRLVYSHSNANQVEAEARRVAAQLGQEIRRGALTGLSLIGPAPCFIGRLRGRYRWQIVVRGRGGDASAAIRELTLPLGWQVDVDPQNLL
jgi:primosomal protein N' (replication factor Y)